MCDCDELFSPLGDAECSGLRIQYITVRWITTHTMKFYINGKSLVISHLIECIIEQHSILISKHRLYKVFCVCSVMNSKLHFAAVR